MTIIVQEVLPPAVRKYLEKLNDLEPVQKGEAQALGKKGVVLQPKHTGRTAPRVPIEGATHFYQSSNLSTLLCCPSAAEDSEHTSPPCLA